MEYLSLREIQLGEYDILKKVVAFFEENGIRYLLTGGTMLGAVRHDGFIPWDDDIDVFVPREDYERLKDLVRSDRSAVPGVDMGLPGDRDHWHPFIKATDRRYICEDTRLREGVAFNLWIDIFPLDHFSDDDGEHGKDVKHLLFMKSLLYTGMLNETFWGPRTKTLKRKAVHWAKRLLFALLGGNASVTVSIDEYAKKMNARNIQSNHVGDGAWPEGMKDYFTLDMVFPLMKHRFETDEFNIPQNYDKYLTAFYGDYMTPPPADKRQGHHIMVYKASEEE